jgi:hypothetical protein
MISSIIHAISLLNVQGALVCIVIVIVIGWIIVTLIKSLFGD